jgi:hypothetical protein
MRKRFSLFLTALGGAFRILFAEQPHASQGLPPVRTTLRLQDESVDFLVDVLVQSKKAKEEFFRLTRQIRCLSFRHYVQIVARIHDEMLNNELNKKATITHIVNELITKIDADETEYETPSDRGGTSESMAELNRARAEARAATGGR